MVSVQPISKKTELMRSDRAAPTVSAPADCGSSPIKASLRDLNIAFARSDVDAILDFFADDIAWHIVGEREIRGRAAARAMLKTMSGAVVSKLTIHSIISDGRRGAVNGVITSEPGSAVAFCDVCRFDASGKIDLMKSYTVELNAGKS